MQKGVAAFGGLSSIVEVITVGSSAVDVVCIEAMGEMFEPWVMRHDAVLGLVGTLRAKPVLR